VLLYSDSLSIVRGAEKYFDFAENLAVDFEVLKAGPFSAKRGFFRKIKRRSQRKLASEGAA
jgi:hypothetical protein